MPMSASARFQAGSGFTSPARTLAALGPSIYHPGMYICLNRVTAGGGLPQEHFVDLAVSAGFQGADPDMGYGALHGAQALADLFSSNRLGYGGWGLPFDYHADAAKQKAGLEALAKQAKVAAELKIDSCCTWIPSSSNLPFIDNWKFHLERLGPVAKIMGEVGLRFGLEFLGPYHIRHRAKHEFIFTPGQMMELADAIGPNVGLLVDSYHVFCSNTPFEEVARLPAERIVWVHLNDAPDLPLNQEQDGHRLLPGEGILHPREFLKTVAQTGYRGPVSLEVFNAELRKMKPQEAADKAWEACKRTLMPLPE